MTIETRVKDAARHAAKGDAPGALAALLEVWRALPAPAVAKVLDAVTAAALPKTPPDFDAAAESNDVVEAPRLVQRLRDVNAAAAVGRIAALSHLERDPRVASELVALLEDPPFHATGSKPFWKLVFELLARNADPRSLSRLKKVRKASHISGASMRGWMAAQLEQAVSVTPMTAPKVPATVARALAQVKFKPPKSPAAPKPGKAVSTLELFRAVYERPDDDEPRALLADVLQEKGDPRGQFIALQLAANRVETRAEQLKLVRKHQRAWLGELANHLGYLAYPSVKEVDPALAKPTSIELWWNRGFPAAARLDFTTPKFIALAGRPEWATLRRIENLARHPELPEAALQTFFTSLRGLRDSGQVTARQLRVLARTTGLAQRLSSASVVVESADELPVVASALKSLGALERLKLAFVGGLAPDVSIVPKLPTLKWLRVTGPGDLVLERVEGLRWRRTGPAEPELEAVLTRSGWSFVAG